MITGHVINSTPKDGSSVKEMEKIEIFKKNSFFVKYLLYRGLKKILSFENVDKRKLTCY